MGVKKTIRIIIGVVGVGISAIGGLVKILGNQDVQKYSDEWLESKSDDELKTEREKVRLEHCSCDEKAWNILKKFDNEMRKRENIGHENEEYKYPKHREHGWYLSNDDD